MTPTRFTVALIALWLLIAVATAFWPESFIVWKVSGIVLLVGLLVDAIQVYARPDIEIQRTVNHNLPIYSWSKVSQRIQNRSNKNLHLLVRDHYPSGFLVDEKPASFDILPGQWIELNYRIKPLSRGNYEFAGTDILRRSPLCLWQRKYFDSDQQPVRIYPNFADISRYILLATDNRLSQLGIKKLQRRGEGNEFHQLREYYPGDSLKQIDWKASSRMRKLISREYQDERDQQIIFMLDCGRRMRHSEVNISHLDQALNAMLLLSYIAVQQGDAVGFKSFAGEARWMPPQKGAHTVNAILNKTYDLPSTLDLADYLSAAQDILKLQRKRALIVLISNTRDDDLDNISAAIRLLNTRHLVVLADLKEQSVSEIQKRTISDLDSALEFHASEQFIHQRKENHRQLRHLGVSCLDVTAAQLPIYLVNEYLAIKRSRRL
ncbi:MAG: DUF58 domain-containing protein [Gammaproteobacteria bacterium]|nr:MAG: DUF58 domain-containing protein [Gammaproteobacteria bacterium]